MTKMYLCDGAKKAMKARYVFVLGSYESNIDPIVVPTNLKNKIHRPVMKWVIKQIIIERNYMPGHIAISVDGYAWHKLCTVEEFLNPLIKEE